MSPAYPAFPLEPCGHLWERESPSAPWSRQLLRTVKRTTPSGVLHWSALVYVDSPAVDCAACEELMVMCPACGVRWHALLASAEG